MLIVITYDVNTETSAGRRRLRRVAKICVNRGQRVQNSVFECMLDQAQYVEMKGRLSHEIDPETDSLRFYLLGNNYRTRIEHIGAKPSYDPEQTLLI
jgi:CRISPR-associated protein Cas2